MFDTRFDTIQRKLAEANSLNQRKIVLLSDATTNDEEQKVSISRRFASTTTLVIAL